MVSLGLKTVAAAGTPVQISATSVPCNALNIQPIKSLSPAVANTGSIYVGVSGMNKSTGVGVLYVLAPGVPATTVAPKSTSAEMDNISNYWIDADNSGDGCLVSYD